MSRWTLLAISLAVPFIATASVIVFLVKWISFEAEEARNARDSERPEP